MAGKLVCSPVVQGGLIPVHALPLSLAEKVEPAVHAAHRRSDDAVPATDIPWPTPHVRHAAHTLWSASFANVPAAHAVHTRSLLAVAATLVKVPATHASLTGEHAPVLLSAEKDTPTVHAAHERSAVVEPAAAWPWPAGHALHGEQLPLPAAALKWPAVQGAHVRSLEGVATLSMK